MASGPQGEPEPVLPDANPRMNDGPCTDQAMGKRGTGTDDAIVTKDNPVPDDRIGTDPALPADLGAGPDHRADPDIAPLADFRRLVDRSRR